VTTNPVIKVNNELFIPIQNKTLKPVVVEGVTYVPVKKAPQNVITSTPILPNKEGPIDTFKINNVTFIPLIIIPKVN
jgi:hypothetical protein